MTVPCRDLECDYAVIGAGVGGLAAAGALSARYPHARIAVFEDEADLGGRVKSRALDLDGSSDLSVIELGAGRYHPRRHRRVHDLVQALGVETQPFAFDMVRATPGAATFAVDETLVALTALRQTAPPDTSFRSVVEGALGAETFDTLVGLCGYDTLRRDELPFVHGLEIISAHPETEAIWLDGPGEWRSLVQGFRRLPEGLAARLGGTVTLHFNHRVTALRRQAGAVVGIEATGPRGVVRVACRHVVCATPLHDLLALSPAARSVVDYGRQVTDVPLVKGYIEFERAFWPRRPRGMCVISASPFRKVYFSSSHARLFFYCDGESAERLAGRLGGEALPTAFVSELPQILPGVDPAQAVACRSDWRHWRRGISFWSGGVQPVEGPIWAPESGLAFLSDINTAELGWLEGALLAVEGIAAHVEPPAPPASRPANHPQTSQDLEETFHDQG